MYTFKKNAFGRNISELKQLPYTINYKVLNGRIEAKAHYVFTKTTFSDFSLL